MVSVRVRGWPEWLHGGAGNGSALTSDAEGRIHEPPEFKYGRRTTLRCKSNPHACPSGKPRKRVTLQVAVKGWGQTCVV